ncbi:MAG: LysR family transcriptional regulator [Sphaerochaetaceae bacterium]
MELKSKLYLVDEEGEKFMGIGVLWLLQKIASEKSLRKAAADLGISYSKAYMMIRNLEASLGVPVVNRQKGGADRSGATLTVFGERFTELYGTFQKNAKERLEAPYESFKASLAGLMDSVEQESDDGKKEN